MITLLALGIATLTWTDTNTMPVTYSVYQWNNQLVSGLMVKTYVVSNLKKGSRPCFTVKAVSTTSGIVSPPSNKACKKITQ